MTQKDIQQLLLSSLQPLENERQELLQTYKKHQFFTCILAVVLLGVVPSLAYFFRHKKIANMELQSILTLPAPFYFLLVGIALYSLFKATKRSLESIEKKFIPKVKEQAYKKVFETWDKNLQYQPSSYLAPDVVKNSNLIEVGDNYGGDDYCIGALEDGRIYEFSELYLREKIVVKETYTTTDSTGNEVERDYQEINYRDAFKGLFFHWKHTEVNAELQQPLSILPKEPSSSTPPKSFNSKQEEKPPYYDTILDAEFVAIPESKEDTTSLFDQFYQVHCSQPHAQELLTEPFCQFLISLKTQWNMNISVRIKEDEIYLAAPFIFDFWRVKMDKSLLHEYRMDYLVWNFQFTFVILEGMAAATRSNYQA